MLAITIPVNVTVFGGAIFLAFLVGFLVRSGQLKKWRKKVIELETEMLSNHADILDLQKEKATLELTLKSLAIPVISINSSKEEKKLVNPETPMRKQLLTQQPSALKKHN